jgi:predicted alpha-1,2-mannosidase
MALRTVALLAAAALGVGACSPPDHPGRLHDVTVSRWVDPFIGTGGHGHAYPGATVPFGMVQVGPDNGRSGWDWSSGYHWSDSVLTGFSHTHLSGTGIGDLLDVLVMPVAGGVDLGAERDPDGVRPYADRLDHDEEEAAPGYYAVRLQRSGIAVELTATPRVGLHRIRYPDGAMPGLVVDLGFAENWDKPTHVELVQIADTLFLGRRYSEGWAPDQRVHFALATSRPVLALTWAGEDPHVRAHLAFRPLDGEPLLLKVALSYVDESGALSNLEAEAPAWDFDGARARAAFAWESELSKVMVSGGTADDRTIFYTALYRTRLAPVLFEDVDDRYRAADERIREAKGFTNHSIFSLWDTFRAAHPLNTLLDPGRVHDLVASMMAFRRETGLLPVWSLVANETNTMTGNHAVPVVVDAVLKGLTRVSAREALAAVVASQSTDLRDLHHYGRFGWIPSDLGVEAVTKTLEYAYDDAAVARLAEHVGAAATARAFRQRSRAWQEVYDPTTGFMRGRRSDGSWVEPFDPLLSDHRQNTDYTEGNAWQHAWFVPHDAGALVGAMGGEEAFVRRLDELFEQDTVVRGENASPDISGLIGQYAHGNEPSHHIAYLYSWAGYPERTGERVRQILDTQYRAAPDGLAGNEDCGQMSAWYVFSALGFYPADPASGVYVLGVPRFDTAVLRVQGGTFVVRTLRRNAEDRYVRAVRLNGRPWPLTYIRHSDVARGGELEFEMGPEPDPAWGRHLWTRPPSDSDLGIVVQAREEAEAAARR